MSFRIWLFISGILALTAVAASAYGAHALNRIADVTAAANIYDTAQLFHMLHAITLFGLSGLLAATEGRRSLWTGAMLQISGVAFLAGIGLFSGGIYYTVLKGVELGVPIIPAGGVLFMVGWTALALSAFGFRNFQRQD